MRKKILFLDLDGTLLNDERQISPGNRAALYEALEQGHRVVINTGRPLESAIQLNQDLGLTKKGCYLISFNGGYIYDPYSGEVIYRQCLTIPQAVEVAELFNQANVHVQSYDSHQVLVEPRWEDESLRRYCNKVNMSYRVLPDFATGLQEEPAKVLAISYTDRAALERIEAQINEQYTDVECFFSCKEFLEVVPKGVHKGNALIRLCELLGMDVADSVAAGDAENDLAMLRAAGTGCAMANGVDAVKQIADYITQNDNNHDGIAEIVYNLMLNQ